MIIWVSLSPFCATPRGSWYSWQSSVWWQSLCPGWELRATNHLQTQHCEHCCTSSSCHTSLSRSRGRNQTLPPKHRWASHQIFFPQPYFTIHSTPLQVLITEGCTMLWPNYPPHRQWLKIWADSSMLPTDSLSNSMSLCSPGCTETLCQAEHTFHAELARFLWLQASLSLKNRCKLFPCTD